MVLAIAALLFQISPATQAITQAGTAAFTDRSDSAPTLFAANLPDATSQPAIGSVISPRPAEASGHSSAVNLGTSDKSSSGDLSPDLSPASLHTALQNSPSLSMIRVPDSASAPLRFITPESQPSRRKWIALSIAQHAAAAFDAYSTRDAISRGAVEQDPFMKPFANSSAIYAAIQACPVALDFAAHHMQRSENNFVRRTWWVPQSVAAGMFLFSGVHNLHVADRQ
jgi:hypothetical protein